MTLLKVTRIDNRNGYKKIYKALVVVLARLPLRFNGATRSLDYADSCSRRRLVTAVHSLNFSLRFARVFFYYRFSPPRFRRPSRFLRTLVSYARTGRRPSGSRGGRVVQEADQYLPRAFRHVLTGSRWRD